MSRFPYFSSTRIRHSSAAISPVEKAPCTVPPLKKIMRLSNGIIAIRAQRIDICTPIQADKSESETTATQPTAFTVATTIVAATGDH
ncbi:hypothetical protein M5K25_017985 [Dendrobium thyrsiflorum]|uniref:Uncharacterized protein n=1 Tax=Dendrobium thyrsiflorum TaxID=117978 RepID=A0ABD0UP14_DENTH